MSVESRAVSLWLLVLAICGVAAPLAAWTLAPAPDRLVPGIAPKSTGSTPKAAAPSAPLQVGVTHTQYTIEPWDPVQSQEVARNVLKRAAPWQNQYIMGWGALNPEPSPGEYNWSTLDRRMELIDSTKGQPVVTLCCSPDWMWGGEPGSTDWSKLGRAPSPEHYGDFAKLAVRVAKRYPQVRHFMVWSELRGFYDPETDNWDIAAYTKMYNAVYLALKRHDPTLQVGGPYAVTDSWVDPATMSFPSDVRGMWGVLDRRVLDALDYWLAHKAGADFVVVNGTSSNRETGPVRPIPFSLVKFYDVTTAVRARTDLPIWWAEVFAPAEDREPTTYSNWIPATVESIDGALTYLQEAGASVALLWDPQGRGVGRCTNCLWTFPGSPGGAEPTSFADLMRRWAKKTPKPESTGVAGGLIGS